VSRVPVIETELGTERLCRGCGDWWPLDGTFWYFKRDGTVMGRCKACWADRRATDDKRPPPLVLS
jgi:hypothetical protein